MVAASCAENVQYRSGMNRELDMDVSYDSWSGSIAVSGWLSTPVGVIYGKN